MFADVYLSSRNGFSTDYRRIDDWRKFAKLGKLPSLSIIKIPIMKAAIVVAVAFCVALIGTAFYLALHQSTHTGPRTVSLDKSYSDRVSSGYWAMGSAAPKVTLTEFADFECPACKLMSPIIQQSMDATKDIAQLQFRIYPLVNIHPNAQQAAEASEAAGRQGKFWAMHDILFANQDAWKSLPGSDFSATLENYANQLHLNIAQFKQDVADSTIGDQIAKDVAAGNAVSLQGTPTMLINGQKLDKLPQSSEELIKLLQQAAQNAHS
jgi:protein-disulfide isomerase